MAKPDPRPQRITKATMPEWKRLRAAKIAGRKCRCCKTHGLVISAHHLLGGNLRADVEDNLIPLCGDGVRGCHGVYTSHCPGEGADGKVRGYREVAQAIRASLTPEETAYIIDKVGLTGLARRYPLADDEREEQHAERAV